MTALIVTLAVIAILAWCITLGTLIYGLIVQHNFVEGMFILFVTASIIVGLALNKVFELLE